MGIGPEGYLLGYITYPFGYITAIGKSNGIFDSGGDIYFIKIFRRL